VLTSDLFDVLLPQLPGAQSDLLKDAMAFQERLLQAPVDKTTKFPESSEMTVPRHSLTGCYP
jgi:hypothetical protein